jgi:hypothetical protein
LAGMMPSWIACNNWKKRLRPPSMASTISERTGGCGCVQLARQHTCGLRLSEAAMAATAASWIS